MQEFEEWLLAYSEDDLMNCVGLRPWDVHFMTCDATDDSLHCKGGVQFIDDLLLWITWW